LNPGLQREAARQQALLGLLRNDSRLADAADWLRADVVGAARAERGLLAYRANAGASAERALAAAYPTLQMMLGEPSFAALSRALWQAHPPQRGDLAQFGASLPEFVAASEQLADEPYLADCVRVDWAVHLADQAEDAPDMPQALERLADTDPAQLVIDFRPGTHLLESTYPVATIWHAHRATDAERFAAVREALAAGQGEQVLVWRQGWRGQVMALPPADAAFVRSLLEAQPLAMAIDAAGGGFDFEAWLMQALSLRWLAAVRDTPPA
jgi:hypothetical protein